MALEGLESAASTLSSMAERIRGAVRPAETFAENRANNTIYVVSELIDELANTMKRLKCIGEAVGASGKVPVVCTTWRILEVDGGVAAVRVKPETVVKVADGRLFFHRDNVRMEVEGLRVKLCKWNYCKEFSAANREELMRELPQVIYLLRFVGNAVRKTAEAALVCARREASECVRI